MSIWLKLFWEFLQIGAFSFGGGYGMIPVIWERCLGNGWLTEEALMNFIAVAESTPGPIAVNMATFVGLSQGGVMGAVAATLGVVLPSFVIILLIAAVIKNFMKFAGVQAALNGVKPVVIGLIVTTGATMLLTVVMGVSVIGDALCFDWKAALLFLVLCGTAWGYRRWRKKALSPILLILLSAALGIALFSW